MPKNYRLFPTLLLALLCPTKTLETPRQIQLESQALSAPFAFARRPFSTIGAALRRWVAYDVHTPPTTRIFKKGYLNRMPVRPKPDFAWEGDGSIPPHFGVADRTMTEATAKRLTEEVTEVLGLLPVRNATGDLHDNALPESRELVYGEEHYGWVQRRGWLSNKAKKEGHNPDYSIFFVRVGFLFFIDADSYLTLPDELKAQLGPNAILIKNLFGSYLGNSFLLPNTMAQIVALMNTPMDRKVYLEAGAGDGTLGLVAAKLGAVEGDLIELKHTNAVRARHNLRINRLSENFLVLEGDFRNADILARLDLKDPPFYGTVLVSDVGHLGSKFATNLDGIALVDLPVHVTDVILGNYRLGAPAVEEVNRLNSILLRDQAELARRGFQIDSQLATFAYAYGYPKGITVAFRAYRKKPENTPLRKAA